MMRHSNSLQARAVTRYVRGMILPWCQDWILTSIKPTNCWRIPSGTWDQSRRRLGGTRSSRLRDQRENNVPCVLKGVRKAHRVFVGRVSPATILSDLAFIQDSAGFCVNPFHHSSTLLISIEDNDLEEPIVDVPYTPCLEYGLCLFSGFMIRRVHQSNLV